jgi:4-hydroxy-tetrahydrodipicolinate synthase
MHSALNQGDYALAMDYLKIIRPIEDYRARAGDSYNISMLKVAIKRIGYDFGPVRPPQRQLTAAEAAEVQRIIEPILIAESKLGNS